MKKLILFVAGIALLSCSPVKVKTRFDKKIDFNQYKTWCWLNGCDIQYEGPYYLDDSTTFENIANLIAVEMQEKGFTQEDDQADLLIDFHIAIKEDSAVFARVHEEDLPFWDDYQDDYYHFLKGSMIIDIIDREKGQVIWQSNAERYMALYPDIDPKTLKRGVKATLRNFPPKSQ